MIAPTAGRSRGRSAAEEAQVDASVDLLGLADTLVRRRWTILDIHLRLRWARDVGALPDFAAIHSNHPYPYRPARAARHAKRGRTAGVWRRYGSGRSQVEVITSEAVLKRVVQNRGLATDPEFVSQARSGQDLSVVALEALAKATKVTRPENTYVLQISVTTKEAIKSARLANDVAAAYLGYQADTTANTARDVSSSIRDRLTELQTELRKSEEEVEAFKRANNVSKSEGYLLGDRKLTDLSARQSAAIARVNETKTRFEIMQGALKSSRRRQHCHHR